MINKEILLCEKELALVREYCENFREMSLAALVIS